MAFSLCKRNENNSHQRKEILSAVKNHSMNLQLKRRAESSCCYFKTNRELSVFPEHSGFSQLTHRKVQSLILKGPAWNLILKFLFSFTVQIALTPSFIFLHSNFCNIPTLIPASCPLPGSQVTSMQW